MEKEIDYRLIEVLVKYRENLCLGRAKPDRVGTHAYIRDSGEYIGIINVLDEVISEELGLTDRFVNLRDKSPKKFIDTGFRSIPSIED